MSAPDSVERASRGELPAWAVVGPRRRAHIARVAALLDEWAISLGVPSEERARWQAAAWLHDALRDAPSRDLRPLCPPVVRDLPGPLLHGPAAAEKLRAEGVTDSLLLNAVAYHTVGCADFGDVGRALYLADFLEPGRGFEPLWRASLRARMPQRLEDVLREVAGARIAHLVEVGKMIRPETIAFWNQIALAP
jgi:HD superfamily phosphohydrolase YqeK